MEKLKNKHDHALTQWLKVIIFAILMMAPFFSVLSRCLYVTCNKNAKDSYSQEDVVYVSTATEYQNNQDKLFYITFNANYENYTSNSPIEGTIYIINVEVLNNDLSFDISTCNAIKITLTNNTRRTPIYTFYNDNTTLGSINAPSHFLISCNVTFLSTFVNFETIFSYNKSIYYYGTYNTLDNAFEYSVNQLTQSQTFNWVTNTAIYQPVNAMTTGLGFDANNNIVALLLTYWAILTAVYVLFDIIISCFVKLTHLISGNS